MAYHSRNHQLHATHFNTTRYLVTLITPTVSHGEIVDQGFDTMDDFHAADEAIAYAKVTAARGLPTQGVLQVSHGHWQEDKIEPGVLDAEWIDAGGDHVDYFVHSDGVVEDG
jgi:hypothetical protein